jgi:flagellar protein FliL
MAADDTENKADADKKEAAPAEGASANAEGGEAASAPKKSKKKLFILLGLVVLLIAGGAGAYFMGFVGGHKTEEEEASKEKPVFYTMPEMVINLASPGKNASFLKATIILELPNALDVVSVEAELPRLMDAFNTYVRELRPSDLSGSAGITRLREELLLRATKALDPIKVNQVLFKEIVVQ